MALKSILIIDDDENVRQSLAIILRRSGYAVSQAKNAANALESLDTSKFDLLFLDIQLPDLDGIELLSIIRKAHPNLQVIILTGTPLSISSGELDHLKVSGNFIKPVDPALLIEFLEKTIPCRKPA